MKNVSGLKNALSAYPKKNILTSLLWLSGITFPSSSAAFAFAPWPQGLIVFVVGCMPTLATIWYYKHWTNEDPNRLQTEDYRIQVQASAKIGGPDGTAIDIDPTTSRLTSNNVIDGGRSHDQ